MLHCSNKGLHSSGQQLDSKYVAAQQSESKPRLNQPEPTMLNTEQVINAGKADFEALMGAVARALEAAGRAECCSTHGSTK
jgi:hypothetical protein